MSRDERFAGFAELLFNEMKPDLAMLIVDVCRKDVTAIAKTEAILKHTIAQRAYDFMQHVVGHSMEYLDECGREIPGSMVTRIAASMPDMRQWPEETSK